MDDSERSSQFMEGKTSQPELVIVIALHHFTAHEKIYVQISSTVDLLFYDAREGESKGQEDLGGGQWGEIRPSRSL